MKRKASNATSCCASAEAVASTGGSPGILGKAGVCVAVKRNHGHAIALAVAFILTVGFTMGTSEAVFAQDAGPFPPATYLQILKGRWVRPDGGYVVEIFKINEDGSVLAAYFNPRPIKVFRAGAIKKKGRINLFVELRDINYPGSQYNLEYDLETDMLKGKYYQAITKQTFDVVFLRYK